MLHGQTKEQPKNDDRQDDHQEHGGPWKIVIRLLLAWIAHRLPGRKTAFVAGLHFLGNLQHFENPHGPPSFPPPMHLRHPSMKATRPPQDGQDMTSERFSVCPFRERITPMALARA